MTTPHSVTTKASRTATTEGMSSIATLLHSLSNKLLPIVVFSEIALRRCEDGQLKPQLEKIHRAAEQARDLLVEIRILQGNKES